MATRQYIGARYVPVYVGTWSAANTYEPLSIVTDGTGNSWTSRKLVPAGTPLQEGEYWALTGVYSAQVQQLENRVTSVELGLAQEQENTDNHFDFLERKDFAIFCGDSYTAATGIDQVQRYPHLMSLALNFDYVNMAVGSAGFLNQPSNPERINVRTQFSNAWGAMTDDEKLRLKYIIIAAGRNDGRALPNATQADYNTEIAQLFNTIKTALESVSSPYTRFVPRDVKIVIIPSWNSVVPYETLGSENAYNYIMQAVRTCNVDLNITLVEDSVVWMMGHQEYLLPDHGHYNAAGHVSLAKHIISAINGNNFGVQYYLSQSVTFENGATMNIVFFVKNYSQVFINVILNTVNATARFESNADLLASVSVPADFPIITKNEKQFVLGSPRSTAEKVEGVGFEGGYTDGTHVTKTWKLRCLYPIEVGSLLTGNISFPLGT